MEEKVSPRPTLSPLLWLASFFAGGIFISTLLNVGWQFGAAAGVFFAIAAAATSEKRSGLVFLLVAFAAAGITSFQIEKNGVAENRLSRLYDEGRMTSGVPLEIEGVVKGTPEPAFEASIFELEAEKAFAGGVELEVSGRVRIFAPAASAESKAEYAEMNLRHGSRIRIACNPERDEKFLNPGVMRRTENLHRQGIDAVATVKSPLLIENLGNGPVLVPLGFVYDQRGKLIEHFRGKFSGPTSGVLIASLLGDKYYLDKETADVFREGGTFHVLVISGLHITFIGGLTLLFVGIFTKRKLWQFVIAVSFLWAYTIAVGADVPVVRASVMFTVLLFSQVIYRKSTLLNALGLCSLLLLSWRPSSLFDPSFQLTFVSVAAIVGMAFPVIEKLRAVGKWMPSADTPFPPTCTLWLRRVCETLYWRESVWKAELGRQVWSATLFKTPYLGWLKSNNGRGLLAYLFEGIVVSLIVQLWLLPLLVLYFHRVSPASTILNLWVGVIIALESFSAIIAVFLSTIADSLAQPFIFITEVLNWLLLAIPSVIVDLDWAGFRSPVYSGVGKVIYVAYFLPVLISAIAANSWNPFRRGTGRRFPGSLLYTTLAAGSVLLAVIVFHPFSAPVADGKLHIDFLDVGQGDAALIRFPDGKTMLIDGGGRMDYGGGNFVPDVPSIGESVVSEYVWEKGYSTVDFVVATHADSDHMQGLTDVVRNFDVGKVMVGRVPPDDPDVIGLYNAATRKNVPVETVGLSSLMEIGGAKVEILFPKNAPPAAASENNSSLVIRLVFGDHAYLFAGDIERQAEVELLSTNANLQAAIVKIPHHGSRSSSTQEFVTAVKAGTAIVSVGRRSMFGHPHAEVVDRWKAAGATVLTTGSKGTITLVSDGRSLEINTFTP